jgi:hypothetical protein
LGHQNLKNEETIAGKVDVTDVVRAGLCVVGQCSMLRWSVCCLAVQYVVTVVCVLFGSAVCCHGGLCVVGQSSMLLRWSVCCLAVQYFVTVVCVLFGSVVCYYSGLCVVWQCNMLLRWFVCCWAEQYVITVVCVLFRSAVCYYGGLCCWAVQYVVTVGLSDGKRLGYRDFPQLKSENTKYENVRTSTDLFEAHVTFQLLVISSTCFDTHSFHQCGKCSFFFKFRV